MKPVEEPKAPTRASTRAKTPRRRTAPEEFKPFIIAALQDNDGQLPADAALDQLPARMEEVLRPGDHEALPQGELRWRYNARRARKELLDEGWLTPAKPGIWALSDKGLSLELD